MWGACDLKREVGAIVDGYETPGKMMRAIKIRRLRAFMPSPLPPGNTFSCLEKLDLRVFN